MTCPRSLDSVSSSVGGAGHDHGFADVADLQRQVDPLARVDGDGEVLRLGDREALELGADAVGADPHVEELIVAILVGHRRCRDTGAGVLQRDRRAWHNGARRIANRAEHRGRIELRKRDGGRDQRHRQNHHQRADESGELLVRVMWNPVLGIVVGDASALPLGQADGRAAVVVEYPGQVVILCCSSAAEARASIGQFFGIRDWGLAVPGSGFGVRVRGSGSDCGAGSRKLEATC